MNAAHMVDQPSPEFSGRYPADPSQTADQQVTLDLGQVIRDHYQEVYRYAYRLSGRAADAEDLTQQAFLIAQQKLHQVRDAGRVCGWLFTVLRSCYLKSLRKKSPASAASLDLEMDSVADELPDRSEVDPQRVQEALNKLPPEFRTVLLMFYFDQYSYKQIAREMDMPIGTVMSRLARAKRRLRSKLVQSRDEPAGANQGVVQVTATTGHPGPVQPGAGPGGGK